VSAEPVAGSPSEATGTTAARPSRAVDSEEERLARLDADLDDETAAAMKTIEANGGVNGATSFTVDYKIVATNDGSLAANFYQTPNFLAQQNKEKGYDFVSIADVHIEPMGIYTSKGYKDVKEIKEGGTIVLNNDPANTARGLKLLAQAGLIELDKSAELPSDTDVTSNPKKLKFTTVDGAQVYKSMPDAEAAVINGNYAIDAGLNPKKDALVLEKGGKDSEYPNQLVVRKDDKDNEHLKKLAKLLNDDKLR